MTMVGGASGKEAIRDQMIEHVIYLIPHYYYQREIFSERNTLSSEQNQTRHCFCSPVLLL